MADKSANNSEDPKDSDVAFMEIVREFPTIYDRSLKDFKDRNKKSNCWKAIAERLDQPVDQIKRRYESIRTQFGKYLKARKGKSGCGTSDIPTDSRWEHLRWLRNYIVSRPSTGNFRLPSRPSSSVSIPDDTLSVSPDSNNEDSDNDSVGTSCQPRSSEIEISVSGQSENGNEPSYKESSVEMPYKKKKQWVKKESKNRQLENTDVQLTKVMNSLNESIAHHKMSEANDHKKMDEDELYAMSLASRLRQLDRRQKAIVRNSIEKIFLDIELGYYNMPQQGSFMQVTMPQGTENSSMYWQSQNLNS